MKASAIDSRIAELEADKARIDAVLDELRSLKTEKTDKPKKSHKKKAAASAGDL